MLIGLKNIKDKVNCCLDHRLPKKYQKSLSNFNIIQFFQVYFDIISTGRYYLFAWMRFK